MLDLSAIINQAQKPRAFVLFIKKAVEEMSKEEIMKNAMDDFEKIQRYMLLAREEKATKTYAELKRQYIVLKALLNSIGVNITELDIIKE